MSKSREPLYTKGAFLDMLSAVSADKQWALISNCELEINTALEKPGVTPFDMLESIMGALKNKTDRQAFLNLNLHIVKDETQLHAMELLLDKKHRKAYAEGQKGFWEQNKDKETSKQLRVGEVAPEYGMTFEEVRDHLEGIKNKSDRFIFLCDHLEAAESMDNMFELRDLLCVSHQGEYAYRQHDYWREEAEEEGLEHTPDEPVYALCDTTETSEPTVVEAVEVTVDEPLVAEVVDITPVAAEAVLVEPTPMVMDAQPEAKLELPTPVSPRPTRTPSTMFSLVQPAIAATTELEVEPAPSQAMPELKTAYGM